MVKDEKIARLAACRLKGHNVTEIGSDEYRTTICLSCHWSNMRRNMEEDKKRQMEHEHLMHLMQIPKYGEVYG